MIPQTHITIQGDTALWVIDDYAVRAYEQENRQCDTCDGRALRFFDEYGQQWGDGLAAAMGATVTEQLCPDCDGTGRHTFEIETIERIDLQPDDPFGPTRAIRSLILRVHVIDVLPIVSRKGCGNTRHICIASDGETLRHSKLDEPEDDGQTEWPITLPSAAEPGQWLVRLKVHE